MKVQAFRMNCAKRFSTSFFVFRCQPATMKKQQALDSDLRLPVASSARMAEKYGLRIVKTGDLGHVSSALFPPPANWTQTRGKHRRPHDNDNQRAACPCGR